VRVVVAVEEGELLGAVRRVVGRVDVENDEPASSRQGSDESVFDLQDKVG